MYAPKGVECVDTLVACTCEGSVARVTADTPCCGVYTSVHAPVRVV